MSTAGLNFTVQDYYDALGVFH